ncbi:hypothetical protein [Methylobacterium sp.]|uniref:hypothetical protein n=1 Tax=Methylobacterium sp. TaxID=409 RepID=UPI003D126047
MSPTGNGRRFVVRVTHEAFIDMLMATAEAALVPPFMTPSSAQHLDAYLQARQADEEGSEIEPPCLTYSHTGLEVGGVLFGRRFRDKNETTLLMQRMVPVSAVNRTVDWIERSPMSAEVMAAIAKKARAPWKRLGDFHSHPLLASSRKDIEQRRLFGPSWQDRLSMEQPGADGIGLIMSATFAKGRNADWPASGARTTYRTRIADLDVWLCAYQARKTPGARRLKLVVDHHG